MWVLDLGHKDGIAKYAILYTPKIEEAEYWAYELDAIAVYNIEKIADIHLPSNSEPIFSFKGRRYEMFDGFDYGDINDFTTTLCHFVIDTSDSKRVEKFLKAKELHPKCFTFGEKKVKHIFSEDTVEYSVRIIRTPLEITDDFREFQVSSFKIRYLDDVNDRWMV